MLKTCILEKLSEEIESDNIQKLKEQFNETIKTEIGIYEKIYLILEYKEGTTLKELYHENHTATEEECLSFLENAAKTLENLHEKNILISFCIPVCIFVCTTKYTANYSTTK